MGSTVSQARQVVEYRRGSSADKYQRPLSSGWAANGLQGVHYDMLEVW
jgi:hypothetical protein